MYDNKGLNVFLFWSRSWVGVGQRQGHIQWNEQKFKRILEMNPVAVDTADKEEAHFLQ